MNVALSIDCENVNVVLVRELQCFPKRRLVDVQRDRNSADLGIRNSPSHASVDDRTHKPVPAPQRRQLVNPHVAAILRQRFQERHPSVNVALLLTLEGDDHEVQLALELPREVEPLAVQIFAGHGWEPAGYD